MVPLLGRCVICRTVTKHSVPCERSRRQVLVCGPPCQEAYRALRADLGSSGRKPDHRVIPAPDAQDTSEETD